MHLFPERDIWKTVLTVIVVKMVGTYSAEIGNYINMSLVQQYTYLQGNRQNSNRCATLAEFFHDLKAGG